MFLCCSCVVFILVVSQHLGWAWRVTPNPKTYLDIPNKHIDIPKRRSNERMARWPLERESPPPGGRADWGRGGCEAGGDVYWHNDPRRPHTTWMQQHSQQGHVSSPVPKTVRARSMIRRHWVAQAWEKVHQRKGESRAWSPFRSFLGTIRTSFEISKVSHQQKMK